MEAGQFCETVKQRAGSIGKDWGVRDLNLFGCLMPSADKVPGKPGEFKASATFWYTGVTEKGDSIKARREVRGLLSPGSDESWKLMQVEYGQIEDLGIFTQFFAWAGFVLLSSLLVGLAGVVAALILPRGLVNFLGGVLLIGVVWYFGIACFGTWWAAALCMVLYLIVAGSASAAIANANA
jgi:hypothetical protein